MFTCTCSDVAVANTDKGCVVHRKWLKQLLTALVAKQRGGCAGNGAMATHGTIQTHDATLYISYFSNRT